MTTGLTRGFENGHPALVAYLMAGYPDQDRSLAAVRAVAEAGADIIELGVPYGDALADGPVIVRAANEAMTANEGGFGLAEAIKVAAEFVASPGVPTAPPIALMTYYNPMLRLGLEHTAELARQAGVSGFIIPDLPPDAAGEWLRVSQGLDTVFLAAPTSTPERLSIIGEMSAGFVYCVSTTGITGERADLPPHLVDTVARVKASTTLPVAVGFGVSTPAQAQAVAGFAQGVVVGSAIVKRQHDPESVAEFVSQLAAAVHGA